MEMGQRIRELRKQHNMTMEELGNILGVGRQAIQKYEKGIVVNIPRTSIEMMAKVFNVSPSYLVCFEETVAMEAEYCDNLEKTNAVKIPVLGSVIAGVPIEAVQDVVDYEEIPKDLTMTGQYFALKVKGDSMQPRIYENDVLIVRKQSDANSGDVVIVLVNGHEATCKKLVKYADGISLVSFNQNYEPMYFSNKEIIERPVQIIGKVVECRQKY